MFNDLFPGLSFMPVPCYIFRVMEPSDSFNISVPTQERLRKKEILCHKVVWRALLGICFYKSVWLRRSTRFMQRCLRSDRLVLLLI